MPEGKVAKNRVHLDIHVEPGRKAAEATRLTRLGAELIDTHDDRGPLTYVMRDPEGNEFCLH
ncbi:MAG: VOC family protein [Trebonia sp.]